MAWSDADKARALVSVAVHKNDYEAAGKEVGIPARTIRRWAQQGVANNGLKNDKQNGNSANCLSIPALLEAALRRMFEIMPSRMDGNNWGVTFGILTDKWLLVQGKPTSRTDSTIRNLGLSQDELDDVLAEADRILAETASSGADQSAGQETG